MIGVILADDEEHIINRLKSQIRWEEWGLELLGTATDGRELLEQIERQHPQIVITDIVMPVMTGLDVADRVKKIHPKIHFILTSAYADFAYARTAMQLGLDDLLPKPIIRSELKNALKKAVMELGGQDLQKEEGENSQTIRMVKDYVQMHYEEKLSLEYVAEKVYLSASYLSRLFRQETGENFKDYLIRIRIDAAKKMLKEECLNINQIADATGFANSKYFSRVFREETGQTPSEYRRHPES